MRLFRNLVLTTCPPLLGALLLAGCSQPQPEVAPLTPASPAVANPAAPAPEAASTEKLPEVLAVNTAQLGGLVEKTLGKVTVVNLWATWCGPCVQEMPDLVKFYNEMDRTAIALISVSLNSEADIKDEIPKFQHAHQVPFPIYVLNETNPDGLLTALRGRFKGGIPTTFFYDKSGKLAKIVEGAIPMPVLLETVKSLVDANP